MSRESEIVSKVLSNSVGVANYTSCSKPGYDGFSWPDVLPEAYCKYFYLTINGQGGCRILIARNYKKMILSGEITKEMLEKDMQDPYTYFPTVTKLKNVINEDVAARQGGLDPENCESCAIHITNKTAEDERKQLLEIVDNLT